MYSLLMQRSIVKAADSVLEEVERRQQVGVGMGMGLGGKVAEREKGLSLGRRGGMKGTGKREKLHWTLWRAGKSCGLFNSSHRGARVVGLYTALAGWLECL